MRYSRGSAIRSAVKAAWRAVARSGSNSSDPWTTVGEPSCPHAHGPREKIYRVARSSHCGSDEGRIKPEIPLATHYVHGLAVSNVLHWFMSPESSPVRNHRTRWAEEP